ncbi:MAG: 16S rRNA (guanine(966)-N(2))-methyltransferase RsmD [Thermotogae bacterium]|nr:16S rRNA (guanine(966)-N(2))-methyltransferase RsmD [Thermotogota bacterium]
MKKGGLQISGGRFKGFKLKADRRVRPTSSFTRKRIYDIIGGVEGYDVLDLFSGSGALGIEALSRGARSCVFVESSGASVKTIRSNLEKLGLSGNVKVVRADALAFLKTYDGEFDLILADPPYAWDRREDLLRAVKRLLKDGGIFIFEMSSRVKPPEIEGLRLFKFVKGGDTAVAFYRKEGRRIPS